METAPVDAFTVAGARAAAVAVAVANAHIETAF